MQFYEAKTDAQLQKVAAWMQSQQAINASVLCWNRSLKTDYAYLKQLLTNPEAHIDYVTDDNGNIKGVIYAEIKLAAKYKMPVNIAQSPAVIIDASEWNIGTNAVSAPFYIGFLRWIMRWAYTNYDVELFEGYSIGKLFNLDKIAYQQYLTLKQTLLTDDPKIGTLYIFTVDAKAFAGSNLK